VAKSCAGTPTDFGLWGSFRTSLLVSSRAAMDVMQWIVSYHSNTGTTFHLLACTFCNGANLVFWDFIPHKLSVLDSNNNSNATYSRSPISTWFCNATLPANTQALKEQGCIEKLTIHWVLQLIIWSNSLKTKQVCIQQHHPKPQLNTIHQIHYRQANISLSQTRPTVLRL